jgi:hypothetical protein
MSCKMFPILVHLNSIHTLPFFLKLILYPRTDNKKVTIAFFNYNNVEGTFVQAVKGFPALTRYNCLELFRMSF